nr:MULTISPECIES: helix-turn-helix transcriptional regulator [unclassified Paenibacillus]
MESEQWVESYWEEAEGRKRMYYRITDRCDLGCPSFGSAGYFRSRYHRSHNDEVKEADGA